MKVLIPALIVCAIMFFVSCSLLVKEEVLYEVTEINSQAADADITYTDDDGTEKSVMNQSLPWTELITISQGDDVELGSVTLTVTNSSSSNIELKITWDK